MSYLRAYIEKCPGFGWQGGPSFKTRIVSMANGRERRNAEQAYARHAYSAPFRNISPADYANIKQMHLVCRGMLHAFKFRDQLDYASGPDGVAPAQPEVFGAGDGAQTVFQLRKISTLSGVSYTRNVYAIRSAVVTVNGVASAPTIDMDRGTVTFAAAPAAAAVLRWTGEFDIWVRFNQDDLPFSIDNKSPKNGVLVNGSVDLIEVPPPEIGE